MKRILCFSLFLLLSVTIMAQTQQGVAYRYNGRNARTPLGNVTISYDVNKRSTISAENGTFSLTLTGKQMGDRIGQVTVKKREMMVFNQQAVDEWSIRKEPLMLILCNADEFEKQKENLIAIGRREAKKKYDKQKAELEAQLNASKIKEAEYEEALDKAYEELERLNKNIGEYAELFARIDESEIDTLAQRAVELFNQGEVEEAIRLFEEGHYMEKLEKALTTSQQADQLMSVAEQAKAKATQDSIKAIESLRAQIEAYKVNNEWQKAGELLKGLADRLNTIEDHKNYADYCLIQKDFKEAEVYYNNTLSLIEKQSGENSNDYYKRKGKLLNNLANLYSNTQRLTEAEAFYNEALAIFVKLAQANHSEVEPDVAMTQANLANLYQVTQRFTEAESIYKEVIEKYRKMAQANPSDHEGDLVKSLNNYALLCANNQRFTEAEKLYKEALEICRQQVSQANLPKHEPNVATTLTNLSNLYYTIQRFNEAETLLKEALEICRRLAQANPSVYEPFEAMILNNMALIYTDTNRFYEAEQLHKEALDIRKRLVQENPSAYEPDLAQTLLNLASTYYETEQYTEAENTYKNVLEICRRLAQKNPLAYTPEVAMIVHDLAILYMDNDHFTEAEAYYKEALEIRRQLAQTNPSAYEPDVAQTQFSYGRLKIRQNQYDEAILSFEEALDIYRRITKVNSSHQKWYEKSLYYLSSLYALQNEHKRAYIINLEWLPILKKQYETDPNTIHEKYAQALYWQSYFNIYLKLFSKAEEQAREGLSVDSTKEITASNLAAALLFQGKYNEAETVYRKYKEKMKDSFLDDFKQFSEAGIIPKEREEDVEKIKRMLNE